MKRLLLLYLSLLLISCSGIKNAQTALDSGNYIYTIEQSIQKLRGNKSGKKSQEYILLLEQAFERITKRDVQRIQFLKKENNPANLKEIYYLYTGLDNLQKSIKPLLPLYIQDRSANADFKFNDYSDAIIVSKNQLITHLYQQVVEQLANATSKLDYRNIYTDLQQIAYLSPNYKNSNSLLEQCKIKGTDHILVSLLNRTNVIIPRLLENDLLNFNTYGLDELWTVYHTTKTAEHSYDYAIQFEFRNIEISPEQLYEKQFINKKEVEDGWKYAETKKGDIKKDSLGNAIKIKQFKTIACKVNRVSQTKYARVDGYFKFLNMVTGERINSFPLQSEYYFENIYASFRGDKRAINANLRPLLNNYAVAFPTNEEMIYATGEDLKAKVKNILAGYAL